jgi:hypothetical protein
VVAEQVTEKAWQFVVVAGSSWVSEWKLQLAVLMFF